MTLADNAAEALGRSRDLERPNPYAAFQAPPPPTPSTMTLTFHEAHWIGGELVKHPRSERCEHCPTWCPPLPLPDGSSPIE